ncbi:TPA: thymidylate kinase [Clostridium botulinum]|nr:thymidylate kinase [Clostridium botulinum]
MKNNGKIIVIEGSDSSGKATQTKKLYNKLLSEGYNVRKITFPNYNSDSSALVKMYLKGDFGDKPEDVNPYVASTFYAVDRFASFKKNWGEFFNNGGIIITDRYTTSNMIHQAVKIQHDKKDSFLDWILDLEFNMYKLPKPDCVIFLDMPPVISQKLMQNRVNKFTGKKQKDIHERNSDFLDNSYKNALYVADKYNWIKINCAKNGEPKSIEVIHNEIFTKVKSIL